MPTSVIDYIRRTVLPHDLGDSELLGRFLERRDEGALAALINRHGPMVWGVCRRLLGHHDAEDAFQATFIVLVRRAASIQKRDTVGNWLYGVAHQTALQARRSGARRRAKEVQVTEMPDAEAAQERWLDLQPMLDQELSRLPDHYRAVIVLSDLEGKTRKEVAAQLGCPEGTVASRLVRARSMLAKRLTRRGVALSAGALAASLSQDIASAAMPASVVVSTIKAASLFAAGQAALSAEVAALTEGVLKTMLLTKLKSVMAVLVVAALVGLIGFGVARGRQKGEEVAPKKQASEKKAEDVIVKEKAEKKEATAWGKEVDGLQAGLVAEAATCRQGDKLKFTVKVRNVSAVPITITYGAPQESAPQITVKGESVYVQMPPMIKGFVELKKQVLKAGETITLYKPEVAVEERNLEPQTGPLPPVGTPTIRVGEGKYKIAYSGMLESHPKLATGSVGFEVKAAKPAVKIKDQVAWGKEVDGLQAGLGYKAGKKRVYRHGEAVTMVVRVRNVGKKEVNITYVLAYFFDRPPSVTDGEGRPAPQLRLPSDGHEGEYNRKKLTLAPGKEVELAELRIELRPESESGKKGLKTLYGTGKFQIQYEHVMYSSGKYDIGSILSRLATGKLDLEIKSEKE